MLSHQRRSVDPIQIPSRLRQGAEPRGRADACRPPHREIHRRRLDAPSRPLTSGNATAAKNPPSVDEEAQQVGPGEDPNRFAVVDDQERILGLQDVASG